MLVPTNSAAHMTIRELCQEAHAIARSHGWWNDENRSIPEMLCLIHSEVSEALEVFRTHGAPVQSFTTELADVIIRICDMTQALGLDLEGAIIKKMAYNRTRPYRHGGKHA